jgi:DNA-binding CsgD family transcriptional regulator
LTDIDKKHPEVTDSNVVQAGSALSLAGYWTHMLALLAQMLALAFFMATEIGYFTAFFAAGELSEVGRFGGADYQMLPHNQAMLVVFCAAIPLLYLLARWYPRPQQLNAQNKVILLAASLVVGVATVLVNLFFTGSEPEVEPLATALLCLCAFANSILVFTGLLCCYSYAANLNKASNHTSFAFSMVAGVVLFAIANWLANDVRVVVFALFTALGYLALLIEGRLKISVAQSPAAHTILEPSSTIQPLGRPPIHLSRNVHYCLFAFLLTLGYSLGSLQAWWQPTTILIACLFVVVCSILYYQLSKHRPLTLGELGWVILPICTALLFMTVLRAPAFASIGLIVALTCILLIQMLNAYWLLQTAVSFNIDVVRHIAVGLLPSALGLLCGVVAGVLVENLQPLVALSFDPLLLRLLVAGTLAVILVTTYALLPFNRGTPVAEGIIYDDFSTVDGLPRQPKASISNDTSELSASQTDDVRHTAPFKERCTAFANKYGLTSREREVLFLLGCGYNAETIAQILIVSSSTVRTHVYRIFTKTNIHSHQDLIRILRQKT